MKYNYCGEPWPALVYHGKLYYFKLNICMQRNQHYIGMTFCVMSLLNLKLMLFLSIGVLKNYFSTMMKLNILINLIVLLNYCCFFSDLVNMWLPKLTWLIQPRNIEYSRKSDLNIGFLWSWCTFIVVFDVSRFGSLKSYFQFYIYASLLKTNITIL